MKIKVSQYLADLAEAEQKGYSRGREDVYRERSEDGRFGDVHEAMREMRRQIQSMEARLAKLSGQEEQSMLASEKTNVGDVLADKCF